jgi:hypothetical protein
MPKEQKSQPASDEWPVPEVFEEWPEDWRPKRTDFGRLQFPCPVQGWEGHITLAWNISAVEYLDFFQKAMESPEVRPDNGQEIEEHYTENVWSTRYHLIRNISLTSADGKELENQSVTADPRTVPDMRLLIWFTSISQEVLIHATNLPNSPKPSRDTLTL